MAMKQEWLNWTFENLDRGCSKDDLAKILTKEGKFSRKEIKHAFKAYVPNPMVACQKTSNGDRLANGARNNFDYEKMSNPNLVKKIDSFGGYRVDDDRLQLYVIPDFLSAKECDELTREIKKSLRKSTITSASKEYGFRTSSTCDMYAGMSELSDTLNLKIAQTLGIRLEWSEVNQGQMYTVGQEFKSHTDYFEPNSKEFKQFASEAGQRTWTFTVYLTDTPKGGATWFTKIDKGFYPKKGQATIWNNLCEDGSPNPWTEHHGMPVEQGEKIIITKWFRDKGLGSPFY